MIPEPALRGVFDFVKADPSNQNVPNVLHLELATLGERKKISLVGGKGFNNPLETIQVENLDFHLQYGSLPMELPFAIRLNDFIAEKYPGTEKSYASFMSRITVEEESSFDYDIYMNHVLDHKGCLLYTSDAADE